MGVEKAENDKVIFLLCFMKEASCIVVVDSYPLIRIRFFRMAFFPYLQDNRIYIHHIYSLCTVSYGSGGIIA